MTGHTSTIKHIKKIKTKIKSDIFNFPDYLHQWSKQLDVPIVSIDYSLAPEAPYPRAIQEVFYSYIWTLEHYHLLGWTGTRIIVTGTSLTL